MHTARFILCEKTNRWAVAFRRALEGTGVRVYETRSLGECWEQLQAVPASLIGLELTAENMDLLVQRLLLLPGQHPRARAIVLAARELQHFEWVLREAGAAHVLSSPRNTAAAVRLVKRHLDAAPQLKLGPRARVWQRLPWEKSPLEAARRK